MHLLSIAITLTTALTLLSTALPTSSDHQSPTLTPKADNIPTLPPSSIRHNTHTRPLTRRLYVAEWVPGWQLDFSDYDIILPGLPAGKDMINFYKAVEQYAQKAAADAKVSAATGAAADVVLDGLRLHVEVDGADVSWYFVERFARMLADLTRDGFEGVYVAKLYNINAAVTVTVTLHVSQIAAAA